MPEIRTVFLSSTSKDLADYREAVIEALLRFDGWGIIHMERIGARAWDADDFCLKKVRECDVFVGIAGLCYGSVHEPSGKSYTHREYDEAVAQRKPRLMYVSPNDFKGGARAPIDEQNAEKQAAFRAEINRRQIRDEFESPGDLARRVVIDLRNWERENETSAEKARNPWPKAPLLAHPYPLPPGFTGRETERRMLTEWFQDGHRSVMAVEAIGGMGKSALSWVWLHWDCLGQQLNGYPHRQGPENLQVAEQSRPEGVVFWSFYDQAALFSAFLGEAAEYVGAPNESSDREKVDALLEVLQRRRILLILDGFERELRAYQGYRAPYQGDEAGEGDGRDCVDRHAADFLRSAASLPLVGRVLLTSRLLPNELEDLAGCRHERLTNFHIDDVVTFFQRAGVKGTRAEIAEAVRPYGGHPLSVGLLAKAIVNDRRMRGDIRAAGRHIVFEKLQGHEKRHILEMAFNELSGERQELLGRLAAFRTPMDFEAIEAASPMKDAALDAALDELEDRGLLLTTADSGRYDLHPIVRRYAYDRLGDKEGVHERLREYFEAFPATDQGEIHSLADLEPVIELYWHMVGAGRMDEAVRLMSSRLFDPLYSVLGAYGRVIELLRALFPHGETQPPRLKNRFYQTWALNSLAIAYGQTGRPALAVPLFDTLNQSNRESSDDIYLGVGLSNSVRVAAIPLGRLRQADESLRRSIELFVAEKHEPYEAVARRELGRLLGITGDYPSATLEFERAIHICQRNSQAQLEAICQANRSQCELLAGNLPMAWDAAQQARRLADVEGRIHDIVWAEWLLGRISTAEGRNSDAEQRLGDVLIQCRRINLIEREPAILLALARLHHDRETALEALAIADRCEYRLDQADIHNLLAELALEAGDNTLAREHAEMARARAWCDGSPYSYKAASDKAEHLLAATASAS